MMSKLATAIFIASLVVPSATFAAGTYGTQAGATKTTDTQSAADKTKNVVGDAAITTKVKAKFAADTQVSAMNIKVDTDNGVVKLSGNARTQDEAAKAADIARSTEGVASVKNDIQVSPAK